MAAKQAPKKETPKKEIADEVIEPVMTEHEEKDNFEQLQDVQVTLSMELGQTWKTLDEVTEIGDQSLIELDKQVGDPVDVFINGKLFARGEVVTISENFGVHLTEIVGKV